jgi:glycosyltransferase involved in cell wall biosynthesis
MKVGVSVIICCYNSAQRLPETLRYLSQQDVISTFPWEIIVVDNASTDNTATIAEEEWAAFNSVKVKLKVVSEPRPGLSFARQKGNEAAAHEYIVFCDDDNWLDNCYLENAFNIIHKNPKIGALGGQCFPVGEIELPQWFEQFKEGYAIGKQGIVTGDITFRGYIWGAGLITRKSLFSKTNNDKYPSLLTGRKGNNLTSGEDSEYCKRLILRKYSLYYAENLTLRHFIPANRLTESYRDRLFESFEESFKCLTKYDEAIYIKGFNLPVKIRRTLAAIADVVRAALLRTRPKYTSLLVLFYFLNWGFKANTDYKIIRHFYTC